MPPTTRPFTSTTAKAIPHAPTTDAAGSNGPSVWGAARLPHVKPPKGNAPRSHSTRTTHSAAATTADHQGRRNLHTSGSNAAYTATHRAHRSVSENHASSPNSAIQYSVAPKNANPKTIPRRNPRRGRASRASHTSGAIATSDRGHRRAGGNAADSASPLSAAITTDRARGTGGVGDTAAGAPTRSPGSVSASRPSAGSDA